MLGELLRDARLKNGMTQEQLAARTRLTREYVSLLELNKRTPTIFVFIRLVRALEQSPAAILKQVENDCPREVALSALPIPVRRTRQTSQRQTSR